MRLTKILDRMPTTLILLVLATKVGWAQQPNDGVTISTIDDIVHDIMAAAPSAGVAIGVARNGELLLAKGYGYANIEHSVPVTAETVFRIGSVTKQFTGIAIMQLVSQGKLQLDATLGGFFPEYPSVRDITVEQLLDHTSGLKNYTGISRQYWLEEFRLDLTDEQLIDLFRDEPADFPPGHGYNYSNSAFYLAGILIERITGSEYSDYIDEYLFRPLGMHSSSYCDQRAIVPNRAAGYDAENGAIVNTLFISMHVPGPAGAICSTVMDLLKWQRALAQNRILDNAAWQRLLEPVRLPTGPQIPYGGGLATAHLDGHRKIGHGGQVNGFWALTYFYPEDDIAIAVLANGPTDIASIEDRIARAVLGLPPQQTLDLTLSPSDLSTFAGLYRVGSDQAHVFADGGKLTMRQGGADAPAIPLLYQGNGLFYMGGDAAVQIKFEMSQGVATSILFTQAGIPISHAERSAT